MDTMRSIQRDGETQGGKYENGGQCEYYNYKFGNEKFGNEKYFLQLFLRKHEIARISSHDIRKGTEQCTYR